jgi:hypothetical protein
MILILLGFIRKPMAAPHIIPFHLQIDDFQLQIINIKRDGYTHN